MAYNVEVACDRCGETVRRAETIVYGEPLD